LGKLIKPIQQFCFAHEIAGKLNCLNLIFVDGTENSFSGRRLPNTLRYLSNNSIHVLSLWKIYTYIFDQEAK